MNAIEVSGLTKRHGRVAAEIIAGYVLGFLGLATFQAIAGPAEAIWLFELDYDEETLVMLFVVVWLLAIAFVMPGIFISTFARQKDQGFPFMPLICEVGIVPYELEKAWSKRTILNSKFDIPNSKRRDR